MHHTRWHVNNGMLCIHKECAENHEMLQISYSGASSVKQLNQKYVKVSEFLELEIIKDEAIKNGNRNLIENHSTTSKGH